jgi:hypothetical protein
MASKADNGMLSTVRLRGDVPVIGERSVVGVNTTTDQCGIQV